VIVDMLTSRGLEVYTREDGRIFPVHQTAKDVVAILKSYLVEAGVDIRLNTPVRAIHAADGHVSGVETEVGLIQTSSVILATGGSSYPNSGTTGDGWAWAVSLGHSIVKVRAALAPMYLELEDREPKAGVALRNVLLKARQNGKELARWRNDLLFTHRGVSGPTVLGISRVVAENWEKGPVTLEIDLRPDDTYEVVSADLTEFARSHPKRQIRRAFEGLVPESIEPELLEAAKIPHDAMVGNVTVKERNRLVEVLKGWKIGAVRAVPLEKGEVVAGGVSLDEVDPQTMRSRVMPGLFLCGEVLDVAGPVGGYNLQAAFATGCVAGESAAEDAP
jgi:predicted Rossmann fold flavoprotein